MGRANDGRTRDEMEIHTKQSLNIDCEFRVWNGIPWRYLQSHLHHLRLSRRSARLLLLLPDAESLLSFYCGRRRSGEKVLFCSSISHKASTARSSSSMYPIPSRSLENDERHWIIQKWNHPHLMVLIFVCFFMASPHSTRTFFLCLLHWQLIWIVLGSVLLAVMEFLISWEHQLMNVK